MRSVVLMGRILLMVVLGRVGTLDTGVTVSVYRDQAGPSSRREDTGLTLSSGKPNPEDELLDDAAVTVGSMLPRSSLVLDSCLQNLL